MIKNYFKGGIVIILFTVIIYMVHDLNNSNEMLTEKFIQARVENQNLKEILKKQFEISANMPICYFDSIRQFITAHDYSLAVFIDSDDCSACVFDIITEMNAILNVKPELNTIAVQLINKGASELNLMNDFEYNPKGSVCTIFQDRKTLISTPMLCLIDKNNRMHDVVTYDVLKITGTSYSNNILRKVYAK